MADLKRPQRVAPRRSSSEDEDDDNEEEKEHDAYVAPAASPRRGSKSSRRSEAKQKNRKAFYNADGTATVAVPSSAPSSARRSPAALPTTGSDNAAVVVVQDNDAQLTSSSLEQIPFASPVFVMDREPHLESSEFWRLWKQAETTYEPIHCRLLACSGLPGRATWRTHAWLACVCLVWSDLAEMIWLDSLAIFEGATLLTRALSVSRVCVRTCRGSFSCIFTNQPTKRDVETHLRAFGFHVVACDAKDNVLQTYFFAHQLGQPDVFFLCEFVLIYSRRFFQATFKCKVRRLWGRLSRRHALEARAPPPPIHPSILSVAAVSCARLSVCLSRYRRNPLLHCVCRSARRPRTLSRASTSRSSWSSRATDRLAWCSEMIHAQQTSRLLSNWSRENPIRCIGTSQTTPIHGEQRNASRLHTVYTECTHLASYVQRQTELGWQCSE